MPCNDQTRSRLVSWRYGCNEVKSFSTICASSLDTAAGVLTHIQNLDQRQNNARIRKTEQKFFLPSQRMYWRNSSRTDVNLEKWKCKQLDECPSGKVPINVSFFLLGSKTFGWQFSNFWGKFQLSSKYESFIVCCHNFLTQPHYANN